MKNHFQFQSFLVLVCILGCQPETIGQPQKTRLQPGKLYDAGQTIYAPYYGFTSIVPEYWKGTVPMDMELFLLLPDTISIGGEIYAFGSQKKNLSSLREQWLKGMAFSESIKIRATDIIMQNDALWSEVVPEGDGVNSGNKGFAMARCGPFGYCITTLAIGPTQCFDDMKKAVRQFMDQAEFTEPSDISIY